MKTVETTKKLMILAACLLCTGIAQASNQPPPPRPPGASMVPAPSMVVGRVYDIQGDLLRYVPETKDWVAVVRDAPFAVEGTLYSGTAGRAELVVPNQTWVRVSNSTQIQFIGLAADLTEVDVASGEARFGNKSAHAAIKATSDVGYVLADAGAVFDFRVGDNSVEVIPIQGTVSFVHAATNARYDVTAGSLSLLADAQQVSSGDGAPDADWERWNGARDAFWTAKAQAGPRSARYLPPTLRDESYVLDENGQWDSVNYEGQRRTFWRPMHVAAGWSPFTVGRWTDWDGDQTWIPAEPFGYMTHHYGNWVYVGSAWYWAPPVVSVNVGLPLLDIGFNWNPGRVSWIHTGANVGWVPLAPQEMYYSHRSWGGHHAGVIGSANIGLAVSIGSLAFLGQAVVVNQRHFSDVRDYSRVRETNINRTTIINNYRAAPVVNNTVINNYSSNTSRYNYTNTNVSEKPHASVLARIDRNEKAIRGGKHENASVVQQQVRSVPAGRINREAKIARPVVTDRIVSASEVSRPQSEVKFKQREVTSKGGGKNRTAAPAAETRKVEQSKQSKGSGKDRPAPPAAESKRNEPNKSVRENRAAAPAAESKKVEQSKQSKGSGKDRPAPPAAESKRNEPNKSVRENRAAAPAAESKKVEQPKQSKGSGKDRSSPPAAESKRNEPNKSVRENRAAAPAAESKKVEQSKQSKGSGKDRPAPPAAESKRNEPNKSVRENRAAAPAAESKKVEQPKQSKGSGKDRSSPPAEVSKKSESSAHDKSAEKDSSKGQGKDSHADSPGKGKSSDKEDKSGKKGRDK